MLALSRPTQQKRHGRRKAGVHIFASPMLFVVYPFVFITRLLPTRLRPFAHFAHFATSRNTNSHKPCTEQQ